MLYQKPSLTARFNMELTTLSLRIAPNIWLILSVSFLGPDMSALLVPIIPKHPLWQSLTPPNVTLKVKTS